MITFSLANRKSISRIPIYRMALFNIHGDLGGHSDTARVCGVFLGWLHWHWVVFTAGERSCGAEGFMRLTLRLLRLDWENWKSL